MTTLNHAGPLHNRNIGVIRQTVHHIVETMRMAAGAMLFFLSPRRTRLRLASVYDADRWSAASCLQKFLLRDQARLDSLEPAAPSGQLANLVADDLIAAYREDCDAIPFSLTGIYPTDGIILWSLIRHHRPDVLFETGTGTAVSSQICLKALSRYHPDGRFVTIGEAMPEVMATAERNLAPFPNVTMIKGRAPADLIPALDASDGAVTGFFIDGPKGSSPDFERLLNVVANHTSPAFIAVHDCEQHIPAGFDPSGKRRDGYINPTRVQLVSFYERRLSETHEMLFMDNGWCERHDDLNDKVYRTESSLRPYNYKGTKQRSHSPFIAVIVPKTGTGAT